MTDAVAPANAPAPVAPVAPAPAAPAAPVAPAVPATPNPTEPPAPVAPTQNVDNKGKVTFDPTGDAGLDIALKFFGERGLTLDSAELNEAGKGNFAYLEAYLKGIADKHPGAEAYLEIAKQAYERLNTKNAADYEARKKTVHDAVGGEETWKNIVEFVKANAEPDELQEVEAQLGKGGVAAKAMAQYLKGLYEAAPGVTKEPASAVKPAQQTAPSTGTLTLTDYKRELSALSARIPAGRMDDSPEYQALKRKYSGVTK